MSEAEMNAYRFGSGKEPTDEMLVQIMHEASVDAKKRHEEATKRYFEELRAAKGDVCYSNDSMVCFWQNSLDLERISRPRSFTARTLI